MKIEHNISRLKYLLEIYKISAEDLLTMVSEGLKIPLKESDIFGKEIKISHLKRIDSVFNKGLHFYLDPKSPEISNDASIFFRKSEFGVDLNIGAKKIVNQFEEFKISLSAIAKLAELDFKRKLPIYSIQQNPKIVAEHIRKEFYPEFNEKPKEFLRSLISKLAEKNILVFEFVETWNKKDKANIDGFFLNPNVIVLKRQQNSFRREIFTLTHELGHYLLNKEEVEQIDILSLASHKISAVERWCNDFAYYFLVGNYDNFMEETDKAESSNDYYFETIELISKNTHLSKIALFTRLLFQNKLSRKNYNSIKSDFEEKFKIKQEEEKKKKELEKLKGIKPRGATPKPINSPLLISTIQTAFYEGVISEFDVCRTLNIKPNKIESFLQ